VIRSRLSPLASQSDNNDAVPDWREMCLTEQNVVRPKEYEMNQSAIIATSDQAEVALLTACASNS
jgi:hypothetical protein